MNSIRESENEGPRASFAHGITKTTTGIRGLDDILHGGLPSGRVTLVAGGPGTGKSMLGLEFLYRSAVEGDPGIFLTFEESAESIRENVASLGWDFAALEESGRLLLVDWVPDPGIAVSGDFNLSGLLSIVEGKARDMKTDRIVIDAIDVLMRVFHDPALIEKQLIMLHTWLSNRRMTSIMTSKSLKDSDSSSQYGFLDFLADCVIYLDQRIRDQVNTKHIQIVKYRGSGYGSNEYPFLITPSGMFFDPISDMDLNYTFSGRRISSGNDTLDEILGGGYQKGSCILISGDTGAGKTSIATTFAAAACERGEKVLYFTFEESRDGLVSAAGSVGIDLQPALDKNLLSIVSSVPESMGIEEHLYYKTQTIEQFRPDHITVDAISACRRIAGESTSFDFIMRLIHFCRKRGITILLINQARESNDDREISGIGISSIIDTVMCLGYQRDGDREKRVFHIRKFRGSKHTNGYHDFALTDSGIRLWM